MNITAPLRSMSSAQAVEHFDVLIVGAGISGVGSAYHLTKQLPDTTFRRAGRAGDLWRDLVDP